MELVAGYHKRYGPYLIYRVLCKECGQTISFHPCFNAFYKRYLLAFVIEVLQSVILEEESVEQLCDQYELSPGTVKRWKKGFASNRVQKELCFFPRQTGPPPTSFLHQLFNYFVIVGNGDAVSGAASGMVRLHDEFFSPLY
jgi:hypothetical protein